MDPLLSQYRGIGSTMVGTNPNSEVNFLIQTTSLAASEAAMYFASIVESTVVSYLELFQLLDSPFNVNT